MKNEVSQMKLTCMIGGLRTCVPSVRACAHVCVCDKNGKM